MNRFNRIVGICLIFASLFLILSSMAFETMVVAGLPEDQQGAIYWRHVGGSILCILIFLVPALWLAFSKPR